MSASTAATPPIEGDVFDQIAAALEGDGYIVLPAALPPALTEGLFQRVTSLGGEAFQRAGIGRHQERHINDRVRTDEVRWLAANVPSEAAFLDWMEALRLGINRRLFLGLFDYEAHFAHYAPGAYYKRHLDAFRGNRNRMVTTVFYLNPEWDATDGGELLIYREEEPTPFVRVLPRMGTLVVFLSDCFPHEVAAARRDRYSIAGWFRVNNTLGPSRGGRYS